MFIAQKSDRDCDIIIVSNPPNHHFFGPINETKYIGEMEEWWSEHRLIIQEQINAIIPDLLKQVSRFLVELTPYSRPQIGRRERNSHLIRQYSKLTQNAAALAHFCTIISDLKSRYQQSLNNLSKKPSAESAFTICPLLPLEKLTILLNSVHEINVVYRRSLDEIKKNLVILDNKLDSFPE